MIQVLSNLNNSRKIYWEFVANTVKITLIRRQNYLTKNKHMKKLLLLAVISASVVGMMQSCKKDTPTGTSGTAALTVAKKQRSLLIYNTATWCGPCGAYGAPEFKGAIATKSSDDLVSIDLHTSGSSLLVPYYYDGAKDSLYVSQFAMQLYGQTKPNGYIPHFYVSNSFLGNTGTTAKTITDFADNYNKNTAVEVGVAANASLSGNTFTVNYKLQAFEPEAGAKYHTSVLLVEKSITSYQNGAANNTAEQEHIIRASMQNDAYNHQTAFSQKAIMDNPAANASVNNTCTFNFVPVGSKWVSLLNANCQANYGHDFAWWTLNKSNTAAVVIVWKYISATEMFYVNSVWADVN